MAGKVVRFLFSVSWTWTWIPAWKNLTKPHLKWYLNFLFSLTIIILFGPNKNSEANEQILYNFNANRFRVLHLTCILLGHFFFHIPTYDTHYPPCGRQSCWNSLRSHKRRNNKQECRLCIVKICSISNFINHEMNLLGEFCVLDTNLWGLSPTPTSLSPSKIEVCANLNTRFS